MSRAPTRKTEATAEEEGKNQVCISTHAVATPSPKKNPFMEEEEPSGHFHAQPSM